MKRTESKIPDRLQIKGNGMGEASAADIEARAVELARMEGRDEVNDGDRERAADELAGPAGIALAPEVMNAELEQITEWDESPDASGHRVDRVTFDDDTNFAERLVTEGIEEADHDLRANATDPEEEEEDV
jgi:hypothetical protein